MHALGDGGRREADAASEVGDAEPGVGLELGEDAPVEVVERFEGLGAAILWF